MFSFTGETMSTYDNRVELDDRVKDPWGLPVARVVYKHHDYDLQISKYCLERVCQVMADSGGEEYASSSRKASPTKATATTTARCAPAPTRASVLDTNCQSHTVHGLYVLDSAFMPTARASIRR